jgi:hypothetical protein
MSVVRMADSLHALATLSSPPVVSQLEYSISVVEAALSGLYAGFSQKARATQVCVVSPSSPPPSPHSTHRHCCVVEVLLCCHGLIDTWCLHWYGRHCVHSGTPC